MPTYDYVCDACNHQFEEFQSITAVALKKCPKCRKQKLRRLIGAGAAIVFRGTGFYSTDHRSASYKKGAAADKASGGQSDAKPAGKDAVKPKAEGGKPKTEG